jgi:hypothetical protein
MCSFYYIVHLFTADNAEDLHLAYKYFRFKDSDTKSQDKWSKMS